MSETTEIAARWKGQECRAVPVKVTINGEPMVRDIVFDALEILVDGQEPFYLANSGGCAAAFLRFPEPESLPKQSWPTVLSVSGIYRK